MYWYVSNLKTRTCSIPYYTSGEQKEFNAQLVIEGGETFRSAYLSLIDRFFIGTVWVQILPDETWIPLGGIFDSACFLGTLKGPIEVCLRFRIVIEATKGTGEFVIPIQLFHGEALPGGPSYLFSDTEESGFPLWGDEESDSPLWNNSSGPPPYWESGSMCGKKEYLYLPPGEALGKWDCVRVATDGDEAAYLAADCVSSGQTGETLTVEKTWMLAHANAGLGEANCRGIIDDDCVNYEHAVDGVVVSDGTSIYWQGGIVDSVVSGRVLQLNRNTRLWTQLSPDSVGERSQHVGFYYDGALYIWGGKDTSGTFLNSLLKFDLTTKAWTTATTGGTARCQAAVVLLGIEAHFVGGVDSEGNVVRTVDIVNMDTLEWSTGTEAPAAFSTISIEATTPVRPVWQACPGILYYGGPTAGRDEQFWEYDGSEWTEPGILDDVRMPGRDSLPNVPLKPVYSLPQHCVRVKAFGSDGPGEWIGVPKSSGRLADVYNEDLGIFSELNIGERRALIQGFCTDETWNLTTGQQQWLGSTAGSRTPTRPEAGWIQVLGEAVSATTFCFRSQTPVYQLVRWANSAWAYDGVRYAYEFGGDDGSGITNRLRRLDYTTMQWEELTAGCTARSHAGMAFSANKLYVVGGIDADGVTLLNTTCIYDVFTETWTAAEEGPYAAGYDWTVVEGAWPEGTFWDGEWDLGFCYKENAVVFHEGTLYRAKQTHLSTEGTEPAVGVSWEDYWDIWTDLPVIYVIGGTTVVALEGDVWVYDPNNDSWNEGIGAGSDFRDNFNTSSADFSAATESEIGTNTNEDSWICSGGAVQMAGLGSQLFSLGIRQWSEGGELSYFQRALIPFALASGEYGASYDLTGDLVYSENNQDSLGHVEHLIGFDRYLYAFGQYPDTGAGVERFGAFRIDPIAGTMNLVASCRSGALELGVNDRLGCSMSFSDNAVYFYGGRGSVASQVDKFDFTTEAFTVSVASGGNERLRHAACIYGGMLYVYYGSHYVLGSLVFYDSAIKIDLETSDVSEWIIPVGYEGTGYDGIGGYSDDDGNLYLNGYLMFSPSTDAWTQNESIFTWDGATVSARYYAGSVYWQNCDGSYAITSKADLGAGYIPLPVTKTVVRNRDGSITVTYSTGEVYTTFVEFTGSSSSAAAPETAWIDGWNAGTGMSNLSSGDPSSGQSITVKTGYSTDDGGQQSVEKSYTVTKTKSGGQRISVQTNYAS